jgi:hypothetical protein
MKAGTLIDRRSRLSRAVLVAIVACAGCAARAPRKTLDTATVTAAPEAAVGAPTRAREVVPVRGPETVRGERPSDPLAESTANRPVAAPVAPAPDPAASVYVFSPSEAVSARPSTSVPNPPGAPGTRSQPPRAGEPPAGPASRPPSSNRSSDTRDEGPDELRIDVTASVMGVGEEGVVTVDVVASANVPIVDAPLHLSFDPKLLQFVDGAPGDFLTQGGSSLVFLLDGQSRPGDVAIALGRVDRNTGAMGEGTLCRLRFKELGAGHARLDVGQATAWDRTGRSVAVVAEGTEVSLK